MSAALPTDAEMMANAASILAAVQRSQLDGYKQRYRTFVVGKLVGRRDTFDRGSPEWNALDQLLRDLGGAPRDPNAEAPEIPNERSAA